MSRRITGAGAVLLALGVAAGACGKRTANTLLVVDVDSDLAERIDEVLLIVEPTGGARSEQSFPLAQGAIAARLPIRAAFIPGAGQENAEVRLTARGRKQQVPVAEQQLDTKFESGERRLVRMMLVAACLTNPCPASQACTSGGACIPRRVAGVPFTPDTGKRDAGSMGTDARPGDAAVGTDGPIAGDGPPGPDAPVAADAGEEAGCVCPSDDNACTDDVCEAGVCKHNPRADRSACEGGVCLAGACCTGCVDGQATCRPGANVAFCGIGGGACSTCNDQDACTQDRCDSGACRSTPLNGTACPGGLCVAGKCRCGGAGEICCAAGAAAAPCEGGLACQNGTCGACGAENQGCCSSNTCASGLLCSSGTCRRCGAVGQACCADGSCAAGAACAAASRLCQACGGSGQACCPASSGDACGANLVCANGVCACGGFGQPCCPGNLCADDRNLCNGTETCQAGRCGRTGAVTCTARSQCHMVGVCDPTTGRCSEPLRPEGTVCNDGNPCSSGDNCVAGTCTPRQASCDDFRPCTANNCTATGCSFPNLPAGTSCGSNNQCSTATCGATGICMIQSKDGERCSTSTGGVGVCSGDVCCPLLSPNCG